MTTPSVVHEIQVPTDPQRTFDLLITPSAIRAWWQVSRAIVLPQHARCPPAQGRQG